MCSTVVLDSVYAVESLAGSWKVSRGGRSKFVGLMNGLSTPETEKERLS